MTLSDVKNFSLAFERLMEVKFDTACKKAELLHKNEREEALATGEVEILSAQKMNYL